MIAWLCETCGTQYAPSEHTPERCVICTDERQYVGWRGQRWTTMAALASGHAVRMEQDDGLLGIGLSPSFAINQRAIVVPARGARILWECTSLVTPQAVAQIQQGGAIDAIAISHPHFYSAMVEWSDALGGVPILLHEADADWIMRPSPKIQLWSGDEHVLAPGLTLLRCGGHFPGSTALHWNDANRPAGALLPGDAMQVRQDRSGVSFLYSYPNMIPMHPRDIAHMRSLLTGRALADVYGFTWNRNIIGNGRAAVDRSFDRYLEAIAA
ncbi:MAG: MBL fold metallo-hydrolase [Alphaproteobacteria bacterium]|nr:MBL fold metallo-hydrolase [Alphaproteobacteria bacterium]MBL7099906.1 MBL fold metallo-hydrolase [Alphaproteobacteria bacterium]